MNKRLKAILEEYINMEDASEHEFVAQKSDGKGFEVLDLALNKVIYRGRTYEECEKAIGAIIKELEYQDALMGEECLLVYDGRFRSEDPETKSRAVVLLTTTSPLEEAIKEAEDFGDFVIASWDDEILYDALSTGTEG